MYSFKIMIWVLVALVSFDIGILEAADKDWKPLFDGKSLEGWTQRGGKASYKVVDNCIVGKTVNGTPNSFLCTEKHYSDFILEIEFKVDPNLNSGIQIRSNVYDKEQVIKTKTGEGKTREKRVSAGQVHGYQVEIDPSKRAWSGGIYDEGRRGWLNDLKKNEKARKAFKQGAWNIYRIEAIGDRIRTWINGVAAADLKDGMTGSGFIGLQVHSSRKADFEVRWRKIRIQDLSK